MDTENLKLTPYSNDELLKITYVITTKLQRLTMLVTTGYLGTEETFAAEDDDPYLAIEFKALSKERLDELRTLQIFKNLVLLNRYVFDQTLTDTNKKHLYEGFGYIGGVGDFCVEAIFPLMQYLRLESGDEYFSQEYFDKSRFNNFLTKFLTKLSLDEKVDYLEDYGLLNLLGINSQGYTFKQLALMLELETERTARGLASTNTPLAKRIRTVKASDGSHRTFIEKDIFSSYVNQYHKLRSVQQEGNVQKVFITLTGGNIRNNHIYLTKVMDLFPDNYIGGASKKEAAAENLLLDVGGGKQFETDIDGKKKIFRSRVALKTFYQTYDVIIGDTVVITEISDGHYSVRPESHSG